MKCKKTIRILSVVVNTLLVFMGSAVSLVSPSAADGGSLASVFAVVLCGIGAVILVVECVSAFKVFDSTLHTAAVALFLLLFMLFSPDMRAFYADAGANTPDRLFDIFDYFFFTGVALTIALFFRHTFRPNGKKMAVVPLFAVGILCFAAYVLLAFYGLQYIALCCFAAALAGWFGCMRFFSYRGGLDNLPFYFSAAILAAATGMQAVDSLYYAGIVRGCVGWPIGYYAIILFCFAVIYLFYFLRNEGAALHLSEYRLQTERLKLKILVGQMKPHFIFNSLTTVKSMYHRNVEAGDGALELFSEYLRESLSMIDTEIVPFEQELQNVARYVTFINIGQARAFDVIYDIEATDFSVPAFSVQPFIENAVKYSRVNEKEDGCILISSRAADGGVELKISDNGVGFNMSGVKEGAHGISNARERFKLLLNADLSIRSSPGEGTEITVYICQKVEKK